MKSCLPAIPILFVICGCTGQPNPAANPPPQPEHQATTASSNVETPAAGDAKDPATAAESKSREFVFHYKFRVKDLKATGDAQQDLVRVWLPHPSTDDYQKVSRGVEVGPVEMRLHRDQRLNNQYRHFELAIPENGEFVVDIPYHIVRREVRADAVRGANARLDAELRAELLAATELVPTTGKPLELIKDLKLADEPMARARQLYDVVDKHVVYKKEGTGWGRGDTNWVCESGYGNCTDFHSLFISLARSQELPAKFEIGFSIPTDKTSGTIAGYHCWAWFHARDKGWIPVDISEADKHPEMKEYYFGNLTADRVMFSVGRDLRLDPAPAAGPLNFFVFPHIEVGRKVLPKENLELQFAYENE